MFSPAHGGGFNTYNQNILNGILLQDNNQYYIFTNRLLINKFSIPDYGNIHLIGLSDKISKTIPRQFWIQILLPVYLLYKKIDVLFSPTNISPFLLLFTKIRVLLVHHTNLPWLFPRDVPGRKINLFFQKLFIKLSFIASNIIIVDSITAKNELIKLFPKIENKIKTILLGVDNHRFSKNHNFSKKDDDIFYEEYFLTISGAVKYHCLIELLSAYEKFRDQYSLAPKFLLISKKLDKKYFEKVQNYIINSRFSKDIILKDDVDYELIPQFYNNAKLYIFSSYCEVFGLTNLEAMCCGIPVLTAKESALPEICGDAAIYFDPKNPDDICNKIVKVYFDEKLKKELVFKGKNQIIKYSWENTCKKTRELLLNLN